MKRSLSFLVLAFILMTSCSKNSGNDTSAVTANKFIGNWEQSQTPSATNPGLFPVSISKANVPTAVVIKNFNNNALVINALVVNEDSLLIPTQVVSGKSIAGSCKYFDSHKIAISYEITDIATRSTIAINTTWR